MKVLMYSGGLDSYIAWHYLGKPLAVYCRLGHRYMWKEFKAVVANKDVHIVDDIKLGGLEEQDANIPMRNLYLAAVGTWFGDEIYLVFQKGEMGIPDRTEKFMSMAGELFSYLLDREIVIKSPFVHWTKTQMVAWYLSQGLPAEALYETTSCFDPYLWACGRCPACFRRYVAFKLNGLDCSFMDLRWEGIETYKQKALQGFYGGERDKEILEALEGR